MHAVTCDAGELLPRLSILTVNGGLFLLHFPVGHPRRTLSVTLLCEARTFLTVIPFGVIPRDSAVCFSFIIPRLARNVKSLLHYGYLKEINGNEEGDGKVGKKETAVVENGIDDGMHILCPLSPDENA